MFWSWPAQDWRWSDGAKNCAYKLNRYVSGQDTPRQPLRVAASVPLAIEVLVIEVGRSNQLSTLEDSLPAVMHTTPPIVRSDRSSLTGLPEE